MLYALDSLMPEYGPDSAPRSGEGAKARQGDVEGRDWCLRSSAAPGT
jgi:hypothetical protein